VRPGRRVRKLFRREFATVDRLAIVLECAAYLHCRSKLVRTADSLSYGDEKVKGRVEFTRGLVTTTWMRNISRRGAPVVDQMTAGNQMNAVTTQLVLIPIGGGTSLLRHLAAYQCAMQERRKNGASK
jgi:hypothetical protein